MAGNISSVLSVAAVDGSGKRAVFSNFGTGVDLAAPGVGIKSLIGVTPDGQLEFGELSGASSSADIAAGAAALLLATGRVDPAGLRHVLRTAATRSTEEGLAVLDAAAAAQWLTSRSGESAQPTVSSDSEDAAPSARPRTGDNKMTGM